jgi:hypothetical protein
MSFSRLSLRREGITLSPMHCRLAMTAMMSSSGLDSLLNFRLMMVSGLYFEITSTHSIVVSFHDCASLSFGLRMGVRAKLRF